MNLVSLYNLYIYIFLIFFFYSYCLLQFTSPLLLSGDRPQNEQFLLIEHGGDQIRIRDRVAAKWREFATYLHLDKVNNLDAEFDRCFNDPFKMADRVIELYLNNARDLNPPVDPSWEEVLEALRKMKEMELVRKLEAYLSSSDEAGTCT